MSKAADQCGNAAGIRPVSAFLTGSQVYGKPRPDSDIDLCLIMDEDDIAQLSIFADDKKLHSNTSHDYDAKIVEIRFGKLNLLIFRSEKEFLAWKAATDELYLRAGERWGCGPVNGGDAGR